MTIQLDTLRAEVARYADQLAESADLADRQSLTAAEALSELYERREWVDEWERESPLKQRSFGAVVEPDSKSRFSKWLAWSLETEGHHAIVRQRTYQLLNAHEVSRLIPVSTGRNRGLPDSERVLRPLDWFRKHKLQRVIPDVWARAVEMAGTAAAVTSTHTTAAVNEWKRDNRGQVLVSIQSSRAVRDRGKAQTAVEVLISHHDRAELIRFNNWIIDRLDKVLDEWEAEANA